MRLNAHEELLFAKGEERGVNMVLVLIKNSGATKFTQVQVKVKVKVPRP